MNSTRYTIEALQKSVRELQDMYPDAKLEAWGIEAFDDRAPRVWADFAQFNTSDLRHTSAYLVL